LELLATHKIDFDMGTSRVPLSDINRGFQMKRDGKFLRVIVTP
jgi:Zn-dependent alcohol dehydrogenase